MCMDSIFVQPEVLVRWHTACLGKLERLQGARVVGQMAVFVCVDESTGDVIEQSATNSCKSAWAGSQAGGVFFPSWSVTTRIMTSAGDDQYVC